MDPDLFFVFGLALGVLSVPAIVSAFLDGRTPRLPAYLILIAALMVGYAIQQKPQSYGVDTIDDTLARVISRYMN